MLASTARFSGVIRKGLGFDLGEDADYVVVYEAVGAENLVVETAGAAGEVGNATACLSEDEKAGSNVIVIEVKFPEAFETTAGYVAQVEGGGTVSMHILQFRQETVDVGQIVVFPTGAQAGETSTENTLTEFGTWGDFNGYAIEVGAVIFFRFKEFVQNGSVDGGENGLAGFFSGYGNRKERHLMEKGGRTVDGIDHPAEFAAMNLTTFFGKDGVFRIAFFDFGNQELIDGVIRFANQFFTLLLIDGKRMYFFPVFESNVAGFGYDIF